MVEVGLVGQLRRACAIGVDGEDIRVEAGAAVLLRKNDSAIGTREGGASGCCKRESTKRQRKEK
jgi:hypothetical protein